VTDAVFHPTTYASGAISHLLRFAARLERSLRNATMARSTHRVLEEMPDGVLRDIGVPRSEIPFVAGALASRHWDLTRP
jgi:uncharacterized protein YjiS (DUF1127 family)